MKGAVDLGHAEAGCVAFERAPDRRESCGEVSRDGPTGSSDANPIHTQLEPDDAEQDKEEQGPDDADQQRAEAAEAVREEEHAN